jgi:hypothetical protein
MDSGPSRPLDRPEYRRCRAGRGRRSNRAASRCPTPQVRPYLLPAGSLLLEIAIGAQDVEGRAAQHLARLDLLHTWLPGQTAASCWSRFQAWPIHRNLPSLSRVSWASEWTESDRPASNSAGSNRIAADRLPGPRSTASEFRSAGGSIVRSLGFSPFLERMGHDPGRFRPESAGVAAIIALSQVRKDVVWRGLLAISGDHAPRSNRAGGHPGDGDQRPSDAITSGSET